MSSDLAAVLPFCCALGSLSGLNPGDLKMTVDDGIFVALCFASSLCGGAVVEISGVVMNNVFVEIFSVVTGGVVGTEHFPLQYRAGLQIHRPSP